MMKMHLIYFNHHRLINQMDYDQLALCLLPNYPHYPILHPLNLKLGRKSVFINGFDIEAIVDNGVMLTIFII